MTFYFYESASPWLFTALFIHNVFHYHFTFHAWKGSIHRLFSTTATLFCHLLKKWNLQLLAGKDISKETGLTMTVTTKTAFLWCTLLKALFLWWHKVRATSHISEDWKAACPHGYCSSLRALPSTRQSMMMVLSTYSIQSPTCILWPFSISLDLDG